MTSIMLDRFTSPTTPPARTTRAPGFLQRLLVSGAALLALTASASAAVVDVSGVYTNNPTSTIGSSNTANMTGNTGFNFWGANNCPIPVITNGYMFTIDTGGGNAVNYTGDISGTGGLTANAGGIGILRLGGSLGNTYTGTTVLNNGPVSLEKSSGNTLCGTITVQGTPSGNFPGVGSVVWTANHQISDSSNVTLTSTASLNLAGFTDTINELHLVTGSFVQTGAGGILKVAKLYINGTQQAEVAKGVGDGYVLGSGWIEVGASGPLVVTLPPAAPATPVPADAASTVNPAYLSKLDWADCAGASSYDVYFWLASGTKPVTPTANVSTSQYTVSPQVLSLSNYKWQVVANPTSAVRWFSGS